MHSKLQPPIQKQTNRKIYDLLFLCILTKIRNKNYDLLFLSMSVKDPSLRQSAEGSEGFI